MPDFRRKAESLQEVASEMAELVAPLGRFTGAMWRKLHEKAQEGYRGWDQPTYFTGYDSQCMWREQLDRHIGLIGLHSTREQEIHNVVDIANLCMFGAYHLEDTGVFPDGVWQKALRGERSDEQA